MFGLKISQPLVHQQSCKTVMLFTSNCLNQWFSLIQQPGHKRPLTLMQASLCHICTCFLKTGWSRFKAIHIHRQQIFRLYSAVVGVEFAIRLSSEEDKKKVGGSSLSLSQQHVQVSLWRTLNNCLRAFTRVTPKISRLSFQANALMETWQPQHSRGKAAI